MNTTVSQREILGASPSPPHPPATTSWDSTWVDACWMQPEAVHDPAARVFHGQTICRAPHRPCGWPQNWRLTGFGHAAHLSHCDHRHCYLADSADSLAWLFDVQGEHPDARPFIESASVLVVGSTTYEWVVSHENLLAEPEKWSTYFGTRPMFVFTSRNLQAPTGADVRFVCGPVRDHLEDIREEAVDGVVWIQDGGDLAGQFLDAGALDEIVLTVAPVFLDGGKPLLPRTVLSDRLSLTSVEQVGHFAVLRYAVGTRGRS